MINLFRFLFIPHHTNNFRAKILHTDFFAVYIIFFFVLSLSFRTIHRISPDILGFATNIVTDKLVEMTNEKRLQAGLNTLRLDPVLSRAAAAKANDMFANNYWAHNSPQGKTPWDFINSSGYVYAVAGENLAKNFSDSEGVVEAWMNSPSHRENLLRPQYEDIGFAVVNGKLNGEDTTLVVQMFGKKVTTQNIAQTPPAQVEIIPPVETVQAETTTPSELPSDLMPSPSNTASIAAVLNNIAKVDILPIVNNVVKNPVFDLGKISKSLVLVLSSVLMLVLVFDLIFIKKHKIVRIGGRNLAHIIFLFLINGIIWFMSFGSIL